jgi:thiamine-phosphate pyrophosphorylase
VKKMIERLHGLYVITDHTLSVQRNLPLVRMVEAAIRGGARIVQYRNKISSASERQREAQALADLCKAQGVLFLINDDVQLALRVNADGLHIGQTDTMLSHARELLGMDRIIGVTCHNRIDLARTAQQAGADYVAFGRFFPSVTKPEATPADLSILQQARAELTIPIAAIGGITPANAPALLAAGADMLAVIHGVFGAADITAAAGEYARLFTVQSRHANQVSG